MSDTRADPIRQHIRELRGMADYAVRGQIVCSDVAMRSWADALESALDGLLADAAEQRESLKREKRASDVESEMLTLRYQAAEARIAEQWQSIKTIIKEDGIVVTRVRKRAEAAEARVAALETALREISTLAAGWRAENARDNNDAISVILHNAFAALAASAPAEEP